MHGAATAAAPGFWLPRPRKRSAAQITTWASKKVANNLFMVSSRWWLAVTPPYEVRREPSFVAPTLRVSAC